MTQYPAHIRLEENHDVVQSVIEHCTNSAILAKRDLEKINLSSIGYFSGLIHDIGKFKNEFRVYIEKAVKGENVKRGSVNHTFAGVKWILENYHNPEDPYAIIVSELIAYAVGAHHGEFDCIDENGKCGFKTRLQNDSIQYEETLNNFLSECREDFDALFQRCIDEITPIYKKIYTLLINEKFAVEDCMFYLGLLARMVLSSVIDADREDTQYFMEDKPLQMSNPNLNVLWSQTLRVVENKIKELSDNSEIGLARQWISDQCAEAANFKSGVYQLNVPTGGGKTLSSLRFALAHANKWNKSRIIFTSPLLSILDQNAQVIRNTVENDDIILEHHSNVVREELENNEIVSERDSQLLTENWHSPIILTTLVQFLNTLFSGKTSSIRRFQALSDSVIVIDEIQSVPAKMLTLFNLAISFLTTVCNATVVLCSATQPAFDKTQHPILDLRNSEDPQRLKNIVPYNPKIWHAFERTEIYVEEGRLLEDFPDFIYEKMQSKKNLLVVCNKKAQAEYLFHQIERNYVCFHLSSAMCMAHRRKTLRQIDEALKKEIQFVCVSTQVIEAGVDISFDCVVRMAAGLDNVIQSAGRCNRNSENESLSPVYILPCSNEDLSKLKEIDRSKTALISLLESFKFNPEKYSYSLSSDTSVSEYYNCLYKEMPLDGQDYPIKGNTLYSLLGWNKNNLPENLDYTLTQAFKTAGKEFEVFDTNTIDVIIPYENGRDIIADLLSNKAAVDNNYRKRCLIQAKMYTISIYSYQKDILEKQEALYTDHEKSIYIIKEEFYDEKTGLRLKARELEFMEV